MLLGIVLSVCAAAMGDEDIHCDVRVKYDATFESTEQCEIAADSGALRIASDVIKRDGLVVHETTGKCFDQVELKKYLNDMPEVMADTGRSYQMTFY